jgi:hypothetical protein
MGPPLKRLVIRIGGGVRRAVGWRPFRVHLVNFQSTELCTECPLTIAGREGDREVRKGNQVQFRP